VTPATFTTLRQAIGPQRHAARILGIGFRTLQRLEAGELGDPLPLKYANLIRGALAA